MRKRAAILSLLLIVALVVSCNQKRGVTIDTQGVRYGRYGPMHVLGKALIDGDIDVDGTANLDDLDVDASGEIEIDGGLVDIGGGTYATADGDNDLGVAGDIEVDGNFVTAGGNYPIGYGTAGEVMVAGTETMTATATAAHGLTTVTWALCTLGVDVDTDAGDPVVCTVAISSNVVTVKLWQDDWSAAATADQTVHWLVVGTP